MRKGPNASAILFAPDGRPAPAVVGGWLGGLGVPVHTVRSGDQVLELSLRSRPRAIVIDLRGAPDAGIAVCRRLKADSYTAVSPLVALTPADDAAFAAAFEAGADEVIRDGVRDAEVTQRLVTLMRRSDRDTGVHPSTRMPGTVEIEAEIGRRLASQRRFGVCYADLDHFKEFNDRYSYNDGDRVIRMLSMILHDVVKGMCGEEGFVGHIGGDDFICIVPLPTVTEVCQEVVAIFDDLVPYQYSEQDRKAGYYFGKDRRGQLHRVPLMTVSIGVVTNERRHFTHAAQVSELATEMKSYAKTLPGSVFSIDRRHDPMPAGDDATVGRADAMSVGDGP